MATAEKETVSAVQSSRGNGGWQVLIEQHDAIRELSIQHLFDRVTLLREVYRMDSFLTDMALRGVEPMDYLDDRLGDTGFTFQQLDNVLNRFPRREAWTETRHLSVLVAQAVAEERAELMARASKGDDHGNGKAASNKAPKPKVEADDDSGGDEVVTVAKETQHGVWMISPVECLEYIHKFYQDGQLNSRDAKLRKLMIVVRGELTAAIGMDVSS